MNTKTTFAGALSLLAVGIGIGIALGWGLSSQRSATHGASAPAPAASAASAAERKVLYWYDPMTPTQRFDKPGKSPFMDMELVPRYADEDAGAASGLSVSPAAVQSLGVRSAKVEMSTLSEAIEAPGTLQLNERDISIVQARAGGFVEKVYARAPGDVIAAGAPLVDLLLPDWVAAQREFLAVKALGDAALTSASRQRLTLLGMSAELIASIERSGQPQGKQTIHAPSAGLIAELMVRQGMTVAPSMTLARINGLGTLWLDVAVPEAQAGSVRVGQPAEARLAAFNGEVFKGKVAAVLPETKLDSHTLRVRIELANPGGRLKAGMFGQATLAGSRRELLTVPAEAVIRTGRRAIAYVIDAPGRFRPVEIEIGAEIGDKLVVLRGLDAGQYVVASAQFLIDSEASLQGIEISKIAPPSAAVPAPAMVMDAPASSAPAHDHSAHQHHGSQP
jgi:Cu(I)/Ag(I) efflux system membrane fusion protein